MNIRQVIVAGAILAASAATARADVIVVDPAGGPGGPLLQAALDAAHAGDILLLRAGDYSGAVPTITGKGIALVADAGQDVVLPGLQASGGLKSQSLLLSGLRIVAPQATTVDADFTLSAGGLIWVENCEAQGHDAWVDATGFAAGATVGLRIMPSPKGAVVARCTLLGGRGFDAATGPGGELMGATTGADGLQLLAVGPFAAVIHDVLATGGRGGDGPPYLFGSNGGAGLSCLNMSPGSIQGGTFQGGDEGVDNPATTKPGFGADISGGTASLRDVTFLAGEVHGLGTPVPALYAAGSTVIKYPAAARHLVLDSPVREFGPAGVHVAAQPGDLAWLLVTAAPGMLQVPKFQGTCVLDQTVVPKTIPLGPVDGAGLLDVSMQLPALPPGMDGIVLFSQLAVINDGTMLLGTASSVVWISAAY